MSRKIRFDLVDGRHLEVDATDPWTAREQVEWEEQFHTSFLTVFAATHFEVRSLLWWSWTRLRKADPGQVPASFDDFVDIVTDWNWLPKPVPASTGEAAPTEMPVEGVGLDPIPSPPSPSDGSQPVPDSIPAQ